MHGGMQGGMAGNMPNNRPSNLSNNMMYGRLGDGQRDYITSREPIFAPHGGLHPGMAHVPRPVHTGHLGNYGPSQYLDQTMMEEYSTKMQMLQHDFDVMLRPKLDALRRQVVTVEERIREVSLAKDELLEEAILDHRALLEQIHLSSDRRLGALTLDLEQLMRDVALIHDLIQQLAPAQQGPHTPTAVWALLSRYDELSNACHQLSSKRFKNTVEESAGDLRQEVPRPPAPRLLLLPVRFVDGVHGDEAHKRRSCRCSHFCVIFNKLMLFPRGMGITEVLKVWGIFGRWEICAGRRGAMRTIHWAHVTCATSAACPLRRPLRVLLCLSLLAVMLMR